MAARTRGRNRAARPARNRSRSSRSPARMKACPGSNPMTRRKRAASIRAAWRHSRLSACSRWRCCWAASGMRCAARARPKWSPTAAPLPRPKARSRNGPRIPAALHSRARPTPASPSLKARRSKAGSPMTTRPAPRSTVNRPARRSSRPAPAASASRSAPTATRPMRRRAGRNSLAATRCSAATATAWSRARPISARSIASRP